VNDVLGGTASTNNQAVTAFLSQYYSESDLDKFFDTQFPAGASTPIKLVGDATDGGRAGVESMLDIEYMPAMGALNPTECVPSPSRAQKRARLAQRAAHPSNI
jgi:hypothetical protein